MINSHPMEDIFIREIEKIVATVFRQEIDKGSQFKKLQAHLEKAKKAGWLRYRAEVLNAISLVYLVYPGRDEITAMAKLQEALTCAEQTDDLDLKLKLISNISQAQFEYAFDISESAKMTERGLIMQEASHSQPVISILFLKLNQIRYRIWQADFSGADDIISQVWAEMNSYVFNSAQRNDYGRGVFFLRYHQLKLYLYHKASKEAHKFININSELFKDIHNTDINTYYYINQALYELICRQNYTGYERWCAKITTTTPDFYFINYMETVMFLKNMGYPAEALHILEIALRLFPQSQAEIPPERHRFFENLRAELIASS